MASTQWHLLMEQLQQTDEAPEGLAGDTGMMDPHTENHGASSPQSLAALKSLQSRLGNQGFKRWLQKQSEQPHPLPGDTANGSNEPQNLNKEATISTSPEANTKAPKKVDSSSQALPKQKKDVKSKAVLEKANSDSGSRSNSVHQSNAPTDGDLLPLIKTFSLALPAPNTTWWRQLEQHYLSRPEKQQIQLVSAFVDQVNRLPEPERATFIDSTHPVSQLHLVQAMLNRLAPQTGVNEVSEPPQPVNPNED
ncbi:MAG: hypothetical protein AAF197_10310 [Pseudomonadota bacterium]